MDARASLLSWVEVDSAALLENLLAFRQILTPHAKLLLVVKANAYGHGLPLVTRLAAASRVVDVLGVHSLEEAHAVRAAGWIGRILIMGQVARARLEELWTLDAELTLLDLETAEALDPVGRKRGRALACHLKLESGTHRQGVMASELAPLLARLREAPGVRIVGASTHFANIEDTTDHSYAEGQLHAFEEGVRQLERAGFASLERQTACTAAILTLPATHFELVRLGIGAYGHWPSRETRVSAQRAGGETFRLRPPLSWKTRIGQLKWIEEGSFVGYGCTHRAGHRTHLAVLPIGYADGYDRGLSGLAHVLVRGRRAPVIGRICMNIVLVDVTDVPGVAREDEVVLLGSQGSETLSAEHLAGWAQTIPYEILSRISPTAPRFVTREGQIAS